MTLKHYYRLIISGNWLTRVFTILLSGISFAFFALASVAVTNNPIDIFTRVIQSYEREYFFVDDRLNGETPLTERGILDLMEGIEEIQNGDGYLYGYRTTSICVDLYRYLPIEVQNSTEHQEAVANGTISSDAIHPGILCGKFENYGEIFTVSAGRYPENKSEIAISEVHYELFKKYGYQDMSEAFYYENKSVYSTLIKLQVDESKAGEVYEINDYDDIIGKTIHFCDKNLTELKIVGVIRMNEGIERPDSSAYLDDKIFLYEEWNEYTGILDNQEGWVDSMRDKVTYLYLKKPTEKAVMRKLAEASLAAAEIGYEAKVAAGQSPEKSYIFEIGIFPLYLYTSVYQYTVDFSALLAVVAAILGIFGFVLNIYLMATAIKRKERKIGILRAMGANDKVVTKIFLTEALMMAGLIFIFGLLVTVVCYTTIFRDLLFYLDTKLCSVALFTLNPLNFLILAACCFVIPLLAALIPIKRFFKKPIVSNIRNN